MIPEVLVQVLYSASQIHRQQLTLEERKVQLKALEMQIDQRNDRMNAQVALTRDLIRALIDRRIDATQAGFNRVLDLYEAQNNHYMEQQSKLEDAVVRSVDPLERANLDARINEIDLQLTRIAMGGHSLFHELNCMVLAIGGTALVPTTDFQRTLAIERRNPIMNMIDDDEERIESAGKFWFALLSTAWSLFVCYLIFVSAQLLFRSLAPAVLRLCHQET